MVATLVTLNFWGCSQRQAVKPPATKPKPREIRAIWVTRFDYRTRRDVIDIVRNCHSLGLNTILFQVRGNGTAFYRSRLEPWADELGGDDPGFDPLAVACGEAHRLGMAMHAYVNVLPAWRGADPPQNPDQLYNKHPDWFWYDQTGRRQPLQSFYVSLNPCLPQVRRYLVDVFHELVTRYDIDGLHLDYIRFPSEPPASGPAGADYPRDPRTVALFTRQTHRRPDDDPAIWSRWRTDQVTQLVRQIRTMMHRTKPKLILSAAVGADPDAHRRTYHQDALRWMREGLIDWVMPMNYTSDPGLFARRNRRFLDARTDARLVPGIMIERPDMTAEQIIRHCRRQIGISRRQANGYCLFAYASLFARDPSDESAVRRMGRRREALTDVLAPKPPRPPRSEKR